MVVAGNSTLVVETNSCPEEGCQGIALEVITTANFKWSDSAAWVSASVFKNPFAFLSSCVIWLMIFHPRKLAVNASVPCQHAPKDMSGNRMCSAETPCGEDGCADVIIWEGWTVCSVISWGIISTVGLYGQFKFGDRSHT